MKLFGLLTFIFLLGAGTLPAQQTVVQEPERTRPVYYNTFLSGGLFGRDDRGTTVSFSTVHGIRFNRLSVGAGIGYDDYTRSNMASGYFGSEMYVRWKSMPLFISASYEFITVKQNALFLQLNGGYSKIWANNVLIAKNVDGGINISPMAGYRLSSGKLRLYFAAGYKWQKNNYEYGSLMWIWGYPAEGVSVTERMERAVLQIGFGWN
jgi:hypothetical protein